MRAATPPRKKQATGTRHLRSCCTSCCTFLCFSLRKKVCLIKDAEPQVGVCQSMDLPTDSVQKHGTLYSELSTINAPSTSPLWLVLLNNNLWPLLLYISRPYDLNKMYGWQRSKTLRGYVMLRLDYTLEWGFFTAVSGCMNKAVYESLCCNL